MLFRSYIFIYVYNDLLKRLYSSADSSFFLLCAVWYIFICTYYILCVKEPKNSNSLRVFLFYFFCFRLC